MIKVEVDLNTRKIIGMLPINASEEHLKKYQGRIIEIEDDGVSYIPSINEQGFKIALPVFRDVSFAEIRHLVINKINEEYTINVNKLFDGTPKDEVSTWAKQESEARSWLSDAETYTPLLDAICLSRGVDKNYLVTKIIEKADALAVSLGMLTGDRQKQEKLVLEEL